MTFNRSPWNWPPDVTRRQRIRDLDMLLRAYESIDFEEQRW